MKAMSSKYAGKCGKCGDTFGPGCRIIWHGRGLPVETAKLYFMRCGSGYTEVGIEATVYATGTWTVITHVVSKMAINPAG